MTDLREKVALAVKQAVENSQFIGWHKYDPDTDEAIPLSYREYLMSTHLDRDADDIFAESAQVAADAAIKAVLEALKAPSREMIAAGGNVHTYDIEQEKSVRFGEYAAASIYPVMIQAFIRDHYLSALAEEGGKEL